MPIVVYLLSLCLVYIGVVVLQIAYCSPTSGKVRAGGIVLGVLSIVFAVVIGLAASSMATPRFP